MYPNGNYQFVLHPQEKKLDFIHRRSSSRFKDEIVTKFKDKLDEKSMRQVNG